MSVGCALIGCQSFPNTAKQEAQCLPGEVKKKNACVVVAAKTSTTAKTKKKRYTTKFKVNPHARHKQTTRIVMGDSSILGNKTSLGTSDDRGNEKSGEHEEHGEKNGKEPRSDKIATFSVNNPDYKYRNYAQSIVSPSEHAPRVVRYQEKEGHPRVRSGNLQFDGLFALANEELRDQFISRTSDKLYQKAKSFACECYGDPQSPHFLSSSYLALAGHLSLSMLTPERMKNSLLFQLSSYRENLTKPAAVPGDENGLQILQRAERFGAWPVYSSRIFWSLAAQSVMVNLPDDQRFAFSEIAYKAMKNTIEIDRDSIFDGSDGLYFGGHDLEAWPVYIQGVDLVGIKSLVVNAVYFRALVFASDLAAVQGDVATSVKYLDWALDLKNAINQHFWDSAAGVYRSLLSAQRFLSPGVKDSTKLRWDGHTLWEQSLVSELGIAEATQRSRISDYTLSGTSPFGEAFSLRAAVRNKNIAVANLIYENVFRRASQKLTHLPEDVKNANTGMNNDGLTSIGAYFSSVVDGVFGVTTSERGISFNPFMTAKLRREQFAKQRAIALYDIELRGKKFDIKIILPKASSKSGYYEVATIKVNGKQQALGNDKRKTNKSKRLLNSTINEIEWSALSSENTIIITLGKLKSGKQGSVKFPVAQESSLSVFPQKKLSSLSLGATVVPAAEGRNFISSWGDEGESLKLTNVNISVAGRYAIQWEYRMDGKATEQEQGLHNGVKRLRLTDANNNELVNKVIQFPIVGKSKGRDKKRKSTMWSLSSPVIVTLSPGIYRVDLDDFMNMSYLKANMTYTGIGGRNGAANRFDVKSLKITPL